MKEIEVVQFNVRIPKDIHKKIREHALRQDIDIRIWTLRAIVEILAHEEELDKKYK